MASVSECYNTCYVQSAMKGNIFLVECRRWPTVFLKVLKYAQEIGHGMISTDPSSLHTEHVGPHVLGIIWLVGGMIGQRIEPVEKFEGGSSPLLP